MYGLDFVSPDQAGQMVITGTRVERESHWVEETYTADQWDAERNCPRYRQPSEVRRIRRVPSSRGASYPPVIHCEVDVGCYRAVEERCGAPGTGVFARLRESGWHTDPSIAARTARIWSGC